MSPYIPLLMLFAFAGILCGVILALSHLLSPNKKSAEKSMTYECGLTP